MIAITTSSSMSVKPERLQRFMDQNTQDRRWYYESR
jgi:hypothetical protein